MFPSLNNIRIIIMTTSQKQTFEPQQKILRLTPYEQIIEAPDMYIGAIRSEVKEEYVIENGKMKIGNIVFSNGCVKN